MPPGKEPERSATVASIGGAWLVVSILLAGKSAFNLILFVSLQPTVPMLLQTLGGPAAAALARAQPLLRYLPELLLLQTAVWTFVAIAALAFLRLRSWARHALRIVAWLSLAYITCVLALYLALQRTAAVGPAAERRFVLGLAILVAIAAALVASIVSLGSARLRAAFDAPSESLSAS